MNDSTLPPDRVQLTGLVLEALVGVHPEERTATQPIEIDLELAVDLRRAGASDRLEDTVDYERLEATVRDIVDASRCYLLEALAERIARSALDEPGVRQVRVAIRKIGGAAGRRTGVAIVRTGGA